MAPDGGSAFHPSAGGGTSRFVELTTDGVPAAERLSFWRDRALRHTEPTHPRESRPFRGRMRRIAIASAEMFDHASDAIEGKRSPARARMAGGDDISVELMRDCRDAWMDHNGEHRLKSGDLYVVDYAQPVQVKRTRHRSAGIVLPRARVCEALGEDLSGLAAHRLSARGLGAVLRQQLCATLDEAASMTPAAREVAASAAADVALAVLQAGRLGRADAEQFGGGFYKAARRLIEHDCTDPDLTPGRVAMGIGCSRASLYRIFAKHNESVAAVIWSARTERAWRMLTTPEGVGMLVSDIAFHCGFCEPPTFTRMFRRRYDMAPRDAREIGATND